jgi:hypothetical protein
MWLSDDMLVLRPQVTSHPAAAERVLSTAHKAKGLEWPWVRLAPDFPSPEELHAVDRHGCPMDLAQTTHFEE